MRTLVIGFVAASALLILPSASAKDFGPGDLRVCNATRCVAIVNREVLPQLGSFYYSGPSPARVRGPSLGAHYYELRFRNDYVTGIVATRRLDRFLSYGRPPRALRPEQVVRGPAPAAARAPPVDRRLATAPRHPRSARKVAVTVWPQ
jgi:hypothetical protein